MKPFIKTEELKQQAPLIPYIKKYYSSIIKIERESNGVAFAKCIFHDEDTASLAFYENGTYKCFGCGEHGDIITLVSCIENCNFLTACIMIAENVGYPIIYEDEIQEKPEIIAFKQEVVNNAKRYVKNLESNPEALNYLLNVRRLDPNTIKMFGLGLTDSEEYKYRKDINNISNCITFPLFNTKSTYDALGFAYKPMQEGNVKYLNDRNQSGADGQNPDLNGIFVKGNLLFGYPQAYKSVIKRKCVFVVEGYFDVMSMHRIGFTNTVGIMGTSLTSAQENALIEMTDTIILMLDFDKAGEINSLKLIKRLAGHSAIKNLFIIPQESFNKPAKDPDDLCKMIIDRYDRPINDRDYISLQENKEVQHIFDDKMEDAIIYLLRKIYNPYQRRILNLKKNLISNLDEVVSSICYEKRELYKSIVEQSLIL